MTLPPAAAVGNGLPSYPLTLDLTGRRVLVVGGGPVALGRVRRAVAAGAAVEVVAPQVVGELGRLASAGALRWRERPYAASDLTEPGRAWLVHTATGVASVDAQVVADAEAAGIWSVRASAAASSPAWSPAVGAGAVGSAAEGIQVAVTAGGDPRRAVALRDAVMVALDTGDLPTRRHRAGPQTPAHERRPGRVALVGGGPGHPDLITVRGRRLLAHADVVVTDRLGPTDLLSRLSPGVEVIDVGKMPGHHPVPQHEINEILTHHAKEGRLVVRLKGGDPFVLGRGGEEALHLAAHGIAVEVVPGVTSAVSVPAAAGIPVTHREITTSFVVASGHEGPDAVLAAARDAAPDATLVLLMGVSSLGATSAGLIAAGRSPGTPVAIIESGWTPAQRTTVTTLAEAGAAATAAGVRPPAVVVVGEVVRVHEQLAALGGLPVPHDLA